MRPAWLQSGLVSAVISEVVCIPRLSSAMVSNEKDINDVFDNILLTEETLAKEGYNEGYEQGLAEGNTEGYQLGYNKGYELGTELGDFYGTVLCYLKTSQPKQVKTLLENLKQSIESFPRTNDPNIDIISEITNIRTQFKRIKAVLKLKDTSDSPSKSADLSF